MLWRSHKPRVHSPRAPLSFIDPCLPTKASKPPDGRGWLHEIKHDGYRLQIHIGPARVRLLTMTGTDWTERYPRIVAAAETTAKRWLSASARARMQRLEICDAVVAGTDNLGIDDG